MDKYNFIKLLRKYLKGEASLQEKNFILSYYNLFEHEPDVTSLLDNDKKNALKEEIKQGIWAQISKEEKPVSNFRTYKLGFSAISVAAALLFILGVVIFFKVPYFSKNQNRTSVVINNLHVEHLMHLPDGSTVILGAGSKLHFASSFAGSPKRDVYLEGSAFFDVVHQPEQPFTVYTGKVKTTVLGTAFSVVALPWYKDITITVKRGKVKVADSASVQGFITPNEQIVYNKEKAASSKKIIDANHYDAWKGTNLIFDDVSVEEATVVIGKKFNVQIVFSDHTVQPKRFSATLSNDDSLESMLKSICEFNNAVYFYDKDKAVVRIQGKRQLKAL